jgi:Region found in RelA / SpoT proteins
VTEVSPEEWGNRYRARHAAYESMTSRLRALIADLIYDAGVDVIQIEGRAKAVDSFVEKIGRKGKKYKDPFADMTDLVGLRIITYYREDVARIGEILQEEFKIDEQNSVDKIAGLAADRFGYLSVHYIVSLSPARQQLAEWRQYALSRDRRSLLKLLNLIEISTISQLDNYLSENILLVPVTGTDLFRKVGVESIEEALTMLIMADWRVSREVFSAIYLPDGWADFARLMEKWQAVKSATMP